MTLSEYERRVLARLEQDLVSPRGNKDRLTRLLPFWPLLACIAAAIPVCVVVAVLGPPSAWVACITGAVAAIALVWGLKRKHFLGSASDDRT